MDTYPLLAIFAGLFVRLAIPIILTIAVVYGLRKLDERWKRVAASGPDTAVQAHNIGCWKINNCPPEKLASCEAYANQDKPCWQVFRKPDGHLKESCLVCQVFRRSPVPVSIGAAD